MADFDLLVSQLLDLEGGYADHPADPGGATQYGITRDVLADWRGRPVSKAEVQALTAAEARSIYRVRFFERIHGRKLSQPIATVLFDTMVHSGPARAIRLMQEALNRQGVTAVTVDGKMRPDGETMRALQRVRDLDREEDLIAWFLALRASFWTRLRNWLPFGLGWLRRSYEVHGFALRALWQVKR